MDTPHSDDNETPDWERDIDAIEEACCRAFVECDFDQLDRMWSDELLVNSPINRVHDKKRVLELLRNGIITHASLERQAETMTRQGPFVVVMGNEAVRNSEGGPLLKRRYTNMWKLADGSWKLVARHANLIPGEPGS